MTSTSSSFRTGESSPSLRRDRLADSCAPRYNDQHSKLIKEFMNIYNPTGAEPVPSESQQSHNLARKLILPLAQTRRPSTSPIATETI